MYCTAAFARKLPTCWLRDPRNVRQSNWVDGNTGSRKRFQLTRKINPLVVHPGKVPRRQVPIGWTRPPKSHQHFPQPKRPCPSTDLSIHASERDVRLGIG